MQRRDLLQRQRIAFNGKRGVDLLDAEPTSLRFAQAAGVSGWFAACSHRHAALVCGGTSRVLPVSSSCIMPCLSLVVFIR